MCLKSFIHEQRTTVADGENIFFIIYIFFGAKDDY